MRLLCLIFLIAFAGAVVLFAQENQQAITVTFFDWGVTASVAAVAGVAARRAGVAAAAAAVAIAAGAGWSRW